MEGLVNDQNTLYTMLNVTIFISEVRHSRERFRRDVEELFVRM